MISVCMATYNGEKYIREQIDSILGQISEKDELVISDDGSSDQTLSIISGYNDPRIKLFHNSGIHGYTGNFYNALSKAKGDFIFLSDQDDVWKPNKVAVVMDYFKKYDFVHHDCIVTDANLNVIEESRNRSLKVRGGFLNVLLRTRCLGCSMAFKSIILKAIFPVPTYTDDIPHDLWISLVSWRFFKAVLTNDKLILYRRHSNTTSNGGVHSTNSLFKRIGYRFKYVHYIKKQKKVVRGIK